MTSKNRRFQNNLLLQIKTYQYAAYNELHSKIDKIKHVRIYSPR